jgi:hypothetical protein
MSSVIPINWIEVEKLTIGSEKRVSIEELKNKEKYLDLENIPPILIDEQNRIIDGVKRYLVLVKLGFNKVPYKKNSISKKVFLNLRAETHEKLMLAA